MSVDTYLMFSVQNDVLVVGKQVGRRDLATRVRALFGKAQDKATSWLDARSTRVGVVNVAVELDVLHEVPIAVGDDLTTVFWVAERWTGRAVCCN